MTRREMIMGVWLKNRDPRIGEAKNSGEVVASPPRDLVKDGTREKLLYRIEKAQAQEREDMLQKNAKKFEDSILRLSRKYFGLDVNEWRDMPRKEKEFLLQMVGEGVQKRMRWLVGGNVGFVGGAAFLSLMYSPFFLLILPLLLFNVLPLQLLEHEIDFLQYKKYAALLFSARD
ncbi:MAG: hypothetical protein HYZ69_03925 [Candidatus Colwellbacteria bacterium]|nr:hypothetical protein [Candidatus Colwellbacteria bacterium]